MHSFRENEDAAIDRHAHEIQSINEREQEALEALGSRRESLIGRAVTLVKGDTHYARKADAIVDRCEAERIVKHRDLEALKERQFAAAQQARLRQAQERKAIAELHRMERQQLAQAHERNRGSEIGVCSAHLRTRGTATGADTGTGRKPEPRTIAMNERRECVRD